MEPSVPVDGGWSEDYRTPFLRDSESVPLAAGADPEVVSVAAPADNETVGHVGAKCADPTAAATPEDTNIVLVAAAAGYTTAYLVADDNDDKIVEVVDDVGSGRA